MNTTLPERQRNRHNRQSPGELAPRQPKLRIPELKKLIFIALIAFGAWQYYQGKKAPAMPEEHSENTGRQATQAVRQPMQAVHQPVEAVRQTPPAAAQTQFSCDGRIHCSQMNSRAEAEFFTRNCPGTKMDGDHDGIPCENDSRF